MGPTSVCSILSSMQWFTYIPHFLISILLWSNTLWVFFRSFMLHFGDWFCPRMLFYWKYFCLFQSLKYFMSYSSNALKYFSLVYIVKYFLHPMHCLPTLLTRQWPVPNIEIQCNFQLIYEVMVCIPAFYIKLGTFIQLYVWWTGGSTFKTFVLMQLCQR